MSSFMGCIGLVFIQFQDCANLMLAKLCFTINFQLPDSVDDRSKSFTFFFFAFFTFIFTFILSDFSHIEQLISS